MLPGDRVGSCANVCVRARLVHRSSLALTGRLQDRGCSLWGVVDGPAQVKAYVTGTPLSMNDKTNM